MLELWCIRGAHRMILLLTSNRFGSLLNGALLLTLVIDVLPKFTFITFILVVECLLDHNSLLP
jgi:hypothetical protein